MKDVPFSVTAMACDSVRVKETAEEPLVTPATFEECAEALRQKHEQIIELKKQLAEEHAKAEELRPKAERYDQIRAINRESGAKPKNKM